LSSSYVFLQVPDEQDLLSRRLRAEKRKLQAAQSTALTVIDEQAATAAPPATSASTTAALPGLAGGGAVRKFTPVTLVFKNLHYYVPNPAAGRGPARGGTSNAPAAGGQAPTAVITAVSDASTGSLPQQPEAQAIKQLPAEGHLVTVTAVQPALREQQLQAAGGSSCSSWTRRCGSS